MKIKYEESMNNTHSSQITAFTFQDTNLLWDTTGKVFLFLKKKNNFQMQVLITIPCVIHWIVSSQRQVLDSYPLVPQKVSLFGHKVFTKVIKLKVIRWALIQYDHCPYKKGEKWTERQTHTGQAPCQDGGRDWSDTFTSQGMQGLPASHHFSLKISSLLGMCWLIRNRKSFRICNIFLMEKLYIKI